MKALITLSSTLPALLVALPILADQSHIMGLPAYTEAILPLGAELYAVSIGPGGPGTEFGSDARNGGLYKASPGGSFVELELSDGEGLRNPTGLVEMAGQIVLVDGNQVVSVSPEGQVNWRRELDQESAFFYDIEVLDDTTLVVSDFGRGAFLSVAQKDGEIEPFLDDVRIGGLARFEITDSGIYAASWGADDAWDSALYRVSIGDGQSSVEKLSDGFGNLESVEVVDGTIVVASYRGHEKFPQSKVMRIDSEGGVYPIAAGSGSQGASDIYVDGDSVWLNYFYDSAYGKFSTTTFLTAP